jgi:hypothetical protein
MERNQIDKKINDAKADMFRTNYANMVRDNDLMNAGFALAQLASVNPQQASALMSMYPSYGKQWQNIVDLENMAIKNDMMMNNYKQKLAVQQQYKEAAQQQRIQSLVNMGIDPTTATAMVVGGYRPSRGTNGSSGSGSGGSANPLKGLSKEEKAGAEVWLKVMNMLQDIQNNPERFKEDSNDHRLDAIQKMIYDASDKGYLDTDAKDDLLQALSNTHAYLWGADNVKKWNTQEDNSSAE